MQYISHQTLGNHFSSYMHINLKKDILKNHMNYSHASKGSLTVFICNSMEKKYRPYGNDY